MHERQYERHRHASRRAGGRTGQVGGEHRLAVAGGERMHSAEQDSHRQVGREQNPVPRLGEFTDAVGEGEVDLALDGHEILEQAHHAMTPSVAAASTM